MALGTIERNWLEAAPAELVAALAERTAAHRGEMTVATLADVRRPLNHHLPKGYRQHPHWYAVARELEEVAGGANPEGVATALMLAFAVGGIACPPHKP